MKQRSWVCVSGAALECGIRVPFPLNYYILYCCTMSLQHLKHIFNLFSMFLTLRQIQQLFLFRNKILGLES